MIIMNILRSNIIQFLIYIFINLLFITKYGLRYLSFSSVILICLVYTLFIVFGFRAIKRLNVILLGSILFILFLFILVIQNRIDPYSIQVDRWSAIHNFI